MNIEKVFSGRFENNTVTRLRYAGPVREAGWLNKGVDKTYEISTQNRILVVIYEINGKRLKFIYSIQYSF